jgi:prepilin-type N-terminal cleavage/methylation domain-containing protein
MRRKANNGFTMMEVIIALGVFAFAITIVLALFAQNLSRAREIENLRTTQALYGVVDAKLKEIGWGEGLNPDGSTGLLESVGTGGTLILVADESGNRVDRPDGGIPANEQYFRLEISAYDEPGYSYGELDGLRGMLALEVLISWPYRTPGVSSAQAFVETLPVDRQFEAYITTIRP